MQFKIDPANFLSAFPFIKSVDFSNPVKAIELTKIKYMEDSEQKIFFGALKQKQILEALGIQRYSTEKGVFFCKGELPSTVKMLTCSDERAIRAVGFGCYVVLNLLVQPSQTGRPLAWSTFIRHLVKYSDVTAKSAEQYAGLIASKIMASGYKVIYKDGKPAYVCGLTLKKGTYEDSIKGGLSKGK